MKLRQIESHHYRVLVVLDPVAGDSVLSMLRDARQFHERLSEQTLAALYRDIPTFGPLFLEGHRLGYRGMVTAKRLVDGLSELVVLNQEPLRRQRAKQPEAEKAIGLRVFFLEYGTNVICTNACYKTSSTPPAARQAALRIQKDFLVSPIEFLNMAEINGIS